MYRKKRRRRQPSLGRELYFRGRCGRRWGEAVGRIHFLGSGDAFNRDGRGSQAIWVESDGRAPFLVDLGPTAMAAVRRDGLDYRRLSHVLITHLHGDHVAGWPFLALNLALLERTRDSLAVVGPAGVRICCERLLDACYGNLLDDSGWAVVWHEIPVAPTDGLRLDDLPLLDIVPVDHHPTSIGYRVHLDDGVVGITGDTRWCAGVEALAKGCEVVILECSSVEPVELPHVSLAELRARRDRLEAPRIVINHLTDAVAAALAADPIPGVLPAHDGLAVPFGPGTDGEVDRTAAIR